MTLVINLEALPDGSVTLEYEEVEHPGAVEVWLNGVRLDELVDIREQRRPEVAS